MLNIVVPMAGRGRRFAEAGYAEPKPLIPLAGAPVIEYVVRNLRPRRPHRFVFLCLAEHLAAYGLRALLARLAPGCEVLPVEKLTDGAASTVLLARDLIDCGEPLMIANSDQLADADMEAYLSAADGLDGLIMTMRASDPKWSFVRLGPGGLVAEVAEKKVLSGEATVGVYNFARGSDFVRAAEEMRRKDLRVNGEFYVAPVYNELIAGGKRVGIYNVGAEFDGMYGLGIPEDLRRFEAAGLAARFLK